jgi:hypothetical protein
MLRLLVESQHRGVELYLFERARASDRRAAHDR